MPKIGMRMIKTSIAVFLCFSVYLFRENGNIFYSVIAAILCMQPDVESSYKVGINRIIGTFIGGIMGMAILSIETWLYNFHNLPYFIFAAIISVMLIPVIYTALLIRKPTASFIACVVFLSITIIHGYDVNPFYFAVNRMIDTLIGIIISWIINGIHLPIKMHSSILMVTDLDHVLLNAKGSMDPYLKIKCNQMLKRGARLAFFTSRSIPQVVSLLQDLKLNLPVIAMGGSVLYDTDRRHYQKTIPLDSDTTIEIEKICSEESLRPFYSTVQNDVLHIYHKKLSNSAETAYYEHSITMPFLSFVEGARPKKEKVLSIRLIDKEEKLQKLKLLLEKQPYKEELDIEMAPSSYAPDYHQMSIYSHKRNTPLFLKELQNEAHCEKAVVVVKHAEDLSWMQPVDLRFVLETEKKLLKEGEVRKDNNMRSLKKMKALLYSKRYWKRAVQKANRI